MNFASNFLNAEKKVLRTHEKFIMVAASERSLQKLGAGLEGGLTFLSPSLGTL